MPFATFQLMERLVICNGSPRLGISNSGLILKKVADVLGDRIEIRDFKERDQWEAWAATFLRGTHVMFFGPLYTQAMPSQVMAFMEKLSAALGSISYFVRSGFPESSQSHYLKTYFEQLSLRLGRAYGAQRLRAGWNLSSASLPKYKRELSNRW